MKIENNGISPLTPKSTDAAQRAEAAQHLERNSASRSVSHVSQGHDKAELSEKARLLSKARAVESNDAIRNERLEVIRQQVESGDYAVQVEEIARRLMARHFTKS